jgi:phosphatidylglycerophosphatase A
MERRSSRAAWVIATWFGCGLVPKGPGTAGALGAIPLYALVVRGGQVGVGVAAFFVTIVGIWAASVVARELNQKDPQRVVVDEVAGMLVTLMPLPSLSWRGVAVGFVLFRFFDIVKPWPVRLFEKLPSGWGIVLDDIVAGILGAVVLVVVRALVGVL